MGFGHAVYVGEEPSLGAAATGQPSWVAPRPSLPPPPSRPSSRCSPGSSRPRPAHQRRVLRRGGDGALRHPRELFTSTFAVSRAAGRCAHGLEQAASRRLIRPSARYTGGAAVAVPTIGRGVMHHDEGVQLGEGWVADWNRHDLDAVMARLHDDIVFSSPAHPGDRRRAERRAPGEAAVRGYWAAGTRAVARSSHRPAGHHRGRRRWPCATPTSREQVHRGAAARRRRR